MRKIEADILNAVKANCAIVTANTVVRKGPAGLTVLLHGNAVAQEMNGTWAFNLAGWNTPTTRSRINAIRGWLGLERVRCKDGCALVGKREVPTEGWWA